MRSSAARGRSWRASLSVRTRAPVDTASTRPHHQRAEVNPEALGRRWPASAPETTDTAMGTRPMTRRSNRPRTGRPRQRFSGASCDLASVLVVVSLMSSPARSQGRRGLSVRSRIVRHAERVSEHYLR